MFNFVSRVFKPFAAIGTLADVAADYADQYAQSVEDAKPINEQQRKVNRHRDQIRIQEQMDDLKYEQNDYQTKREEKFAKQRLNIAKRKLKIMFTNLDAEMQETLVKGATMDFDALQEAIVALEAKRTKLNSIKALTENSAGNESAIDDFNNNDPFAGIDTL